MTLHFPVYGEKYVFLKTRRTGTKYTYFPPPLAALLVTYWLLKEMGEIFFLIKRSERDGFLAQRGSCDSPSARKLMELKIRGQKPEKGLCVCSSFSGPVVPASNLTLVWCSVCQSRCTATGRRSWQIQPEAIEEKAVAAFVERQTR